MRYMYQVVVIKEFSTERGSNIVSYVLKFETLEKSKWYVKCMKQEGVVDVSIVVPTGDAFYDEWLV